jgi:hypothetical protein
MANSHARIISNEDLIFSFLCVTELNSLNSIPKSFILLKKQMKCKPMANLK